MTQHTPAPWRYVSRNIDEKANWASRIPFAIELVVGGAVAPVADVLANPLVEVCAQPQAEANARLIAASPLLLAFAKWCVSARFDSRELGSRAEAAIAAATGTPTP